MAPRKTASVTVAVRKTVAAKAGPDMAYSSITGNEMPRANLAAGMMSPLVGIHRTQDSRWLMLSMLDEEQNRLRTWAFANAFPIKWTGPQFNVGQSAVASVFGS